MKLIIKQYLASLRERNELDALLPDLLSQMGLNVFSKPGRGTRQDGVDVAAVGSLNGEPEKVYLFSIKAGDLTRSFWDSSGPQSLRPSLNEIRDSYIPNRLPKEHKDRPLVICLCFGGDIQELVRTDVAGYIQQNSTDSISYEEWNGDRLAELIQANFLRADLLPDNFRPMLRKALALLDEPEASFRYYTKVVSGLLDAVAEDSSRKVTSIRQMSVCLWILFAWARDVGNLESAYLSAERTVLFAWELTKDEIDKKTKASQSIKEALHSILFTYFQVAEEYVVGKLLPHVTVMDGLSSAVRPSSSIDVNLKLFDVLGRMAIYGLWLTWSAAGANDKEQKEEYVRRSKSVSNAIMALILNNSILLLPIKDEQGIDIFLAMIQLGLSGNNTTDFKLWLTEIINRAKFTYEGNGPYPCTTQDYASLLDHPKRGDKGYREQVTQGSLLYPVIALWAALLKEPSLYNKVAEFKDGNLQHCNFQFWYPDELSEVNLYTNKSMHGAVFSNVPVGLPAEEFLQALWSECDQAQHFEQLSAQNNGFWPLILLACRHYRIPVPVQFSLSYRNVFSDDEVGPCVQDDG